MRCAEILGRVQGDAGAGALPVHGSCPACGARSSWTEALARCASVGWAAGNRRRARNAAKKPSPGRPRAKAAARKTAGEQEAGSPGPGPGAGAAKAAAGEGAPAGRVRKPGAQKPAESSAKSPAAAGAKRSGPRARAAPAAPAGGDAAAADGRRGAMASARSNAGTADSVGRKERGPQGGRAVRPAAAVRGRAALGAGEALGPAQADVVLLTSDDEEAAAASEALPAWSPAARAEPAGPARLPGELLAAKAAAPSAWSSPATAAGAGHSVHLLSSGSSSAAHGAEGPPVGSIAAWRSAAGAGSPGDKDYGPVAAVAPKRSRCSPLCWSYWAVQWRQPGACQCWAPPSRTASRLDVAWLKQPNVQGTSVVLFQSVPHLDVCRRQYTLYKQHKKISLSTCFSPL